MHGVVGSGIARPSRPQPTPPGTYRGLELDPAQPRPTFTLTDTTGKPYDFATRTRGTPTLVEQAADIFESVGGWQCTSMPMTGS